MSEGENGNMKEYVAGFLFNEERNAVALILKTHPSWQAGKYNAIGGKVEIDENPLDAMRREFKEETGLEVDDWREFALLSDERGWVVRFYWAVGEPWACKKMTDERPVMALVSQLPKNIIPNLRWLIPMAASMKDERCDSFVIREFKAHAG